MDDKSKPYALPSEIIARMFVETTERGPSPLAPDITALNFAARVSMALTKAGYTIVPTSQLSSGTQIASDEGENPKMDRATALTELKRYQVDGDAEIAHLGADRVLRFLLCAIGYADVIFEYDKVKKWYA